MFRFLTMQQNRFWKLLGLASLVLLSSAKTNAEPLVRMQTDFGDFFINLTPQQAPLTVENFLTYVNSGAYDDSFFHRNPRTGGDPLSRFVLQGGEAFWPQGSTGFFSIPENPPVVNEFNVSNTRGTVAMAKLDGDPNSATNNFFINLIDNGANLDNQNGGFTVFGTVDEAGLEIIDTIAALPVGSDITVGFTDIPSNTGIAFTALTSRNDVVIINSAEEFTTVAPPAAAILPASRSVSVNQDATGFVSITNGGTETAASCSMALSTEIAADFFYRQTNPLNNEAFGRNNPQVDIPANQSASFVFTITPTEPLDPTNITFEFRCGNATATAALVRGVNTFDLTASNSPLADVVALAGTEESNGINDIPLSVRSGAFVVATVNLGAQEDITVAADTGDANLPLDLFVCPTDAATGLCLEGQGPTLSVTRTMATNETGTFAVFAQLREGANSVAFDPTNNRAFVRFTNSAGALRGSTSVALRTTP